MHKNRDATILAIVVVVVVVIIIGVVSTTAYIAKSKLEKLNTKNNKNVISTEDKRSNSETALITDQSSSPKDRYAFIYVGQLRSWKKCIPKWRDVFAKLKPDIYLFLNTDVRLPKEEFQKVFGPDANIKSIEYWNRNSIKQFDDQMEIKYPKMFYQARVVMKDDPEIQVTSSDPAKLRNFPAQVAQIQEVFQRNDFTRDYDIVVKMRMDIVPRKDWEFEMTRPFDKPEHVVPSVYKLWKDYPNYKEEKVHSVTNARIEFGETFSLGGAYFINPDGYRDNIDESKAVWMIADLIYWSSAKNMQNLHKDIFDRYGDYITPEYGYSWCPENHLFFHTKHQDLQPLMVMHGVEIVR